MKFKSHKTNWATVLCAAAVFSFITLRDAQAAGNSEGILAPQPIGATIDPKVPVRPDMPPMPIDNDLTTGEQLSGDFSGVLVD